MGFQPTNHITDPSTSGRCSTTLVVHSQQQLPAGHLANSSCTLIIYTEPAGATQIRASLRSLALGQQVNGGEDVAATELTASMEGKSKGLPRNVE